MLILIKVSVVDVSAVGEVLDTFPVCQTPVTCITSVPRFNPDDPDVLASWYQFMLSYRVLIYLCDRLINCY